MDPEKLSSQGALDGNVGIIHINHNHQLHNHHLLNQMFQLQPSPPQQELMVKLIDDYIVENKLCPMDTGQPPRGKTDKNGKRTDDFL
jgi:hypothetical protein